MDAIKHLIGGLIALGTLGLLVSFMTACALLPIVALIWIVQQIT